METLNLSRNKLKAIPVRNCTERSKDTIYFLFSLQSYWSIILVSAEMSSYLPTRRFNGEISLVNLCHKKLSMIDMRKGKNVNIKTFAVIFYHPPYSSCS